MLFVKQSFLGHLLNEASPGSGLIQYSLCSYSFLRPIPHFSPFLSSIIWYRTPFTMPFDFSFVSLPQIATPTTQAHVTGGQCLPGLAHCLF